MDNDEVTRDRLIRALSLALHEGTGDNESKAAMLGMLRIARGLNMTVESFVRVISGDRDEWEADDDEEVRITRSPLCDVRFPFGKYRNKTMADIARIDFGYLRWIATKFGDPEDPLRIAAKEVIRFMAAGGRV